MKLLGLELFELQEINFADKTLTTCLLLLRENKKNP